MSAEQSADRPLRDFGLWLGMIGPPSVWLIQFQTIYLLVYPACGAQRNLVIGVTCLVFCLAISAMGVYPLRNLRDAAGAQAKVAKTRRFMALVAVMSTSLFLLVVIAQWLAAALVDPCPI